MKAKLLILSLLCLSFSARAEGPAIIPAPVRYSESAGYCSRPQKVKIEIGRRRFNKQLAALPDYARREAYRLSIKPKGIKIEALSEEGAFRARTTLEQLMAADDTLRCCSILDYPRFRHRGLMIDESRSFKGLNFLKKQVDAMAQIKLNVLHLHLTDAAGWRLQVPAYPALADSAAWRIGKSYFDWERAGYPFANAYVEGAYGGFYTAAELRELVSYAAERFVTVIPEIEMPGHSMEVNRVYPSIACVGPDGRPRSFAWDLCPGNEGTFELLRAVLDEVMDIFPSEFIHIGGDEAVMKDWKECVNCRRRMEEEGFSDVHELQGYLMRRVEGYLRSHGRRAIGWDEILDSGLSREAVIMSWRGISGGVRGSAAGRDVILSPSTHCYLNYYQDLIRKEPAACGELVSLRFCYGYEPIAPGMDESHILGLQGNLWCEYIPTPEHAEYMLYPRLFAIAETGWSPAEAKDFCGFRERAAELCGRFRERYYTTFDLDTESELARSGFQRFEQLEAYKQSNSSLR